MTDVIRLVQGDSKPDIQLTLTDEATGLPIDLSGATTSVSVKFRLAGSSTLLSTISCTKSSGGADGKVFFNFTGGVLNVDPGMYEGEIQITYGSSGTQTVYDMLKFRVRGEF
jgi:hypothetical protein